jgi:hypothetical protein
MAADKDGDGVQRVDDVEHPLYESAFQILLTVLDTASDKSPGAPASWSTLPTELKLNILGQRLSITGKLSYITHLIRSNIENLLPILLTTKEFNTLTT